MMSDREYVIKASYGNDSLALIQWMYEQGHAAKCYVVHNDTGWARASWAARIDEGEAFARRLGMLPVRLQSVGFVKASKLKRAFPRSGMQFCTTMLKIEPTIEWLNDVDPDAELVGVVGVRRSESARRARWPEWTEDSELDGGRSLWSPLVRMSDAERNALIKRAGFEVLGHRSEECFPCVNASRADLRQLADEPDRIAEIDALENLLTTLSTWSTGGPIGLPWDSGADEELERAGYPTGYDVPAAITKRRMFRRQNGIHETIAWAQSAPGKYNEGQGFMFGCDAGFCGT